jgi:hypothetical protein
MRTAGDVSAEPTSRALTARLWTAAASTYSAILEHPFVTGLGDGSLDRASFQFYIVQDGHYLHGFARALALLAARGGGAVEVDLQLNPSAAVDVNMAAIIDDATITLLVSDRVLVGFRVWQAGGRREGKLAAMRADREEAPR